MIASLISNRLARLPLLPLLPGALVCAAVSLVAPALGATAPDPPATGDATGSTVGTPKPSPFPPMAQLMAMPGVAGKGHIVFQSRCSMCHVVNGKGYDFGPELSEIGNKLGKDGLLEAILEPSAGISTGYEGTEVTLTNGRKLIGILISDGDNELTLRFKDAKPRDIPRTEVAARRMLDISLMPADVTKGMTTQNLVDVVAYLTTLLPKEPEKPGKTASP